MSGRPAWLTPTTVLVVAIAMLGPLDTPPLGPALPAIADEFSLSAARAGLVISAYAATGMVLAPVIGSLADRHGRRRVLIPCLFGYGVAGVAIGFAPSFTAVLALRALQGIVGGSILTSLAYTLVGDLFDGTARTGAMGAATAGASLTAAVGPALGGTLAAEAWNAPFALYSASLVVGVAVVFWLPEPRTDGGDDPEAVGGAATEVGTISHLRNAVSEVPTGAALRVYGACFLGYGLFFGGVLTTVTFLLSERFGLDTAAIGALVTAATLVTAAIALGSGRFAQFASASTLVSVGISLEGFGLAVAGVAGVGVVSPGSTVGLALVAVGLLLFGVGYGLFQPALAALLSRLGPPSVRGGVMSLRTSVLLAGQAVSAPLFTLSAIVLGYGGVLIVAGVVGAILGAGSIVNHWSTHIRG